MSGETKNFHFKKHAIKRIGERCTASVDHLYWMLKTGRFSVVAREGKHRLHLAVWIEQEGRHHVLVADERNGDVVTLIPCNYGQIASSLLDEAKRLASGGEAKPSLAISNKPKVRVKAFFLDNCGIRRFVNLLSWDQPSNGDLKALPEDLAFCRAAALAAQEKGCPERVQLILQAGKKGDVELVSFDVGDFIKEEELAI